MVRPFIFRLDPEKSHELASLYLRGFGSLGGSKTVEILPQRIGSLTFANPVGLAAGFDKKGNLLSGLEKLDFGFVETGTFTKAMQEGNPKPRIFRIPELHALLNSMGFNNPGIDAGLANLAAEPPGGMPIGVSIGKSKETPPERAIDDYIEQIQKINNAGIEKRTAYVAINISSPNTPGLRHLQTQEYLSDLILECRGCSKFPIFVKLSPDFESDKEFVTTLETLLEEKVDGIIVTNTTNNKKCIGQYADRFPSFQGGISGAPLKNRSLDVLKLASKVIDGGATLISSGGVMNPEDVWERLLIGADLVQIYTGMIYYGPGLALDALRFIKTMLNLHSISTIEEFQENRKYL